MNNDKIVSVPFKALRDFLEHSACTYKAPEWTKNKAALRNAMNKADHAADELADLRAKLAERDVLLRESLCHAQRMEPMSVSCFNRIDAALSAAQCSEVDPQCSEVLRTQGEPVDAILLEDCEEVVVQGYGRGYFATDDCVRQVYTLTPAPVERKRHVARTDAVYDASWVGEKLPVPKCVDALRPVDPKQEIVAIVESALSRSFKLGQIYWQQADSDSTCQQNKSDQTLEVQAQHILNVVKSIKELSQ